MLKYLSDSLFPSWLPSMEIALPLASAAHDSGIALLTSAAHGANFGGLTLYKHFCLFVNLETFSQDAVIKPLLGFLHQFYK